MNGVLDEIESFTLEIKVLPIYYSEAHGAWFVPTGTKDRPAGISNGLYNDAYAIFAMKDSPIKDGDMNLARVEYIKQYIKENLRALPKTVMNNELGFLLGADDIGLVKKNNQS